MSNFTYNLMKQAMDATSLRQETISSNIANVNTPEYKVNKVEFESLLNKASNGLGLTKTNDRHLGLSSAAEAAPIVTKRTNTAVKDNGNNVDIDMEMTDQAENTLEYNALVSQLNARYAMLRSVITK